MAGRAIQLLHKNSALEFRREFAGGGKPGNDWSGKRGGGPTEQQQGSASDPLEMIQHGWSLRPPSDIPIHFRTTARKMLFHYGDHLGLRSSKSKGQRLRASAIGSTEAEDFNRR